MCQIISLYKPFWITILGHVLKNYFFGTSNVLAIKSCSQLKKIDLPRNYDFWTVFFKKFQKTFFFKKMFEEIALFPKKIFLKKTHFFKQKNALFLFTALSAGAALILNGISIELYFSVFDDEQ